MPPNYLLVKDLAENEAIWALVKRARHTLQVA